MKLTTVVIVTLIVGGCVQHYFQPPKPAYQYWTKQNATEMDIKKAILACGDPAPDSTTGMYKKAFGYKTEDEIQNHIVTTDACMERAGYKSTIATFRESCTWDHLKHLPICQLGAKIPKPSVERRLNSWWCKLKTDRAYCYKHAYVSSACDNPKKDYNNPPPECRP